MKMGSHKTRSVEETMALASEFADNLSRGDVVALFGDLGAGKTQFVKGICRKFGAQARVTSPSFVILNRYYGEDRKKEEVLIFHLDLYRVRSYDEIYDLGYEEFLQKDGVCLIEWAEVIQKLLPPRRFDVNIQMGDEDNERIFNITKVGG